MHLKGKSSQRATLQRIESYRLLERLIRVANFFRKSNLAAVSLVARISRSLVTYLDAGFLKVYSPLAQSSREQSTSFLGNASKT